MDDKERITFLAEPEVKQGILSYVNTAKENGRKMNMSRAVNEILASHLGLQALFVQQVKESKERVPPATKKRNVEMKRLRYEELKTLQEIADIYNISRERVRQIVGNNDYKNNKTRRKRKKARANTDATNDELAKILNVSPNTIANYRSDIRHAVKSGSCRAVGHEWEEWTIDKLSEMGAVVEGMPLRHPYDLEVNGYRVDVKYCDHPRTPPSTRGLLKSPQWVFGTKGDSDKCDFFFCITGNKDIFIIPSGEVGTKQQVVFCYPTERPSLGKYQKYLDRYDLLGIE